jgi:alpha-1,3-rhamnosyltransferase
MKNTLVTVIISSFNSSSFIIETLESVFIQTWKNLELVITDDSSLDETVELCSKWLEDKRERFFRAKIITSKINTGISANANRGLKASKGDWIKFLGADDALMPDCIENNVIWITNHPKVKVLFSFVDLYRDTFEPYNKLTKAYDIPDSESIVAFERSAYSQYRMLLISDRIHFSPSVFISREAINFVNGFDERYKMLEDYPLWLNLTKCGFKLHFMDKATVNYRMHSKAINNNGLNCIVNPNYFDYEEFRREYIYPNLPIDLRLYQRFNWYLFQIFRFKMFNKNSKGNNILYSVLTVYLNPFKFFIWIKKKIYKNLKNNEFYI